MQRRFLLRILPFWVLLLAVGSLLPTSAKDAIGTTDRAGLLLSLHRVYHIAAFCSTALLLLLLSSTRFQKVAAVVAGLSLGILMECAQHWTYHNALEWWDIRDDAIGVLLACLVSRWTLLRNFFARFI